MPNHIVSGNVDTMMRAADNAAIRSAIGVGTTDAPTFLNFTATGASSSAPRFAITSDFLIVPNGIGLGVAMIGGPIFGGCNTVDSVQLRNNAGTSTVRLAVDANEILAQRNGVNAQAFRVYNTYTDASNYERVSIGQSAGAFRILAENLGAGTTARQLQIGTNTFASLSFLTDATVKWQISAAGHFLAATDNTYDIGASGANRPRNVYMGSWIRMAVTTVASLPAAATAGAGARMFVSDALTPVFGSAVTGGGSVNVPVYSTGSAWNVG